MKDVVASHERKGVPAAPVNPKDAVVDGDTSEKSKNDLAKELAEVDRIGGYKHGFVGGFYVETPAN